MGVVIGLHGGVDFVDIEHKSVRCARSIIAQKKQISYRGLLAQDLESMFLCSPLFEVHTPRTISAVGHALMTWDDSSTTNTSLVPSAFETLYHTEDRAFDDYRLKIIQSIVILFDVGML